LQECKAFFSFAEKLIIMKQLLIALLLSFCCYTAQAKDLILKFNIDTISINGSKIATQRLSEQSYADGMSSKENGIDECLLSIMMLQQDLKEIRSNLLKGYYNVKSVDTNVLDKAKMLFKKNDFSLYFSEIDFYNKIAENKKNADKLLSLNTTCNKLKIDTVSTVITEINNDIDSMSMIENSMRLSHRYATQFSNMRLNFVNMRVQNYMENNAFIYYKEPVFTTNDKYKILTENYISKFSNSTSPDKITLKYFLKQRNKEYIIDKCIISGDYNYVISFFVKFFPTIVNVEDIQKKEIAYCYYYKDKISFIFDRKFDFKILISENK